MGKTSPTVFFVFREKDVSAASRRMWEVQGGVRSEDVRQAIQHAVSCGI